MKRTIIRLSLAVAVFAAFSLVFLAELLSRAAERALAGAGAREVDFAAAAFGPGALHVRGASLRWQAGAHELDGSISAVLLPYRAFGLRISPADQIEVRGGSFSLRGAEAVTPVEAIGVSVEKLLSIVNALPAVTLRVTDCSVTLPDGKKVTFSFRGDARNGLTADVAASSEGTSLTASAQFDPQSGAFTSVADLGHLGKRAVHAALSGTFDKRSLVVKSGSSVQIADSTLTPLPEMRASVSSDLVIRFGETGGATIDGGVLSLESSDIRAGPAVLSGRAGTVTLRPGPLTPATGVKLDLTVDSFQVTMPSYRSPELTLKGAADVTASSLQASLSASLGKVNGVLLGTLNHEVDEGRGSLQVRTSSKALASAGPWFGPLHRSWTFPFDATTAGSNLELGFTWGGRPGVTAKAAFQNAEARFGQITLSGVTGVIGLSFVPVLSLLGPAELRIGSVSGPFPVEAVRIRARPAGKGTVQLESGKLELLGGEMHVGSATFSRDPLWSLPIELRNVQLDRLLALYPQQHVTATGAFDATFALEHSSLGLQSNDGKLEGRPPGGTIRLAAAAPGSDGDSGGGAAFALAALSDFRYDTLRATFSLDPQGKLLMKVFIGGRNPQWQGGRRVELNVNLEENVLQLLRTFRLLSEIENEVSHLWGG